MNTNIINIINQSKKSLYKISQDTGIPYTTINELYNNKKNINNIAAETVYKLSLYFNCDIKDILNPFPLLKGSKGKYMGIKYKWISYASGLELHIFDKGEDIVLTQINPAIPKWYKYYSCEIIKMLIENYINNKKIEEKLL